MIGTIQVRAAAERIQGVLRRTPLLPAEGRLETDPRVQLRFKLECLQETGSFKPRGAWNQISQLDEAGRAAGVVATSSGNHGRALAWAARRGEVPATLFMPADAYPNKIEAARTEGARVVLCETRREAERRCEEAIAEGAVLIHPYDAARTVEGAGTVGLEIAQDWPEVEVVVLPVGGGGLISGSSLALREELGTGVRVFGVEPEGAPSMTRGLAAGDAVELEEITTRVQGLSPLFSGKLNVELCSRHVDRVFTLPDEEILAAQARLVREGDWVVEPAGAAASALVLGGHLPAELLAGRTPDDPLRVVAVVSGGNPDPAQLEALRAGSA